MTPAAAFPGTAELVSAPDPDSVGPGTTAFIVIVLLAIAVIFLLRSFVKQTKRVNFDENREPDDGNPDQPDP